MDMSYIIMFLGLILQVKMFTSLAVIDNKKSYIRKHKGAYMVLMHLRDIL